MALVSMWGVGGFPCSFGLNPLGNCSDLKTVFLNCETYLDARGYLRIAETDYLYHREVYREAKGGSIPKDWVIHHIDGDKLNNHIGNLIALPWALHTEIHDHCRQEGIKFLEREVVEWLLRKYKDKRF